MNVLVTAGSTTVPIDAVRTISNVFGGRTGTAIAKQHAASRDTVTLLTSNPVLAANEISSRRVQVRQFRSFEDLAGLLEQEVRSGQYDVVVHSAAVSDFKVAGATALLHGAPLHYLPQEVGKIPSGAERLQLDLVPLPKLIDQIRAPWGFDGVLVKFKLEVGLSDAALVQRARQSLRASRADLIVANCLEWSAERAFILGEETWVHGSDAPVARTALPMALRRAIIQQRKVRL